MAGGTRREYRVTAEKFGVATATAKRACAEDMTS